MLDHIHIFVVHINLFGQNSATKYKNLLSLEFGVLNPVLLLVVRLQDKAICCLWHVLPFLLQEDLYNIYSKYHSYSCKPHGACLAKLSSESYLLFTFKIPMMSSLKQVNVIFCEMMIELF